MEGWIFLIYLVGIAYCAYRGKLTRDDCIALLGYSTILPFFTFALWELFGEKETSITPLSHLINTMFLIAVGFIWGRRKARTIRRVTRAASPGASTPGLEPSNYPTLPRKTARLFRRKAMKKLRHRSYTPRQMAALVVLALTAAVEISAAQADQQPSEAAIFHMRTECKKLTEAFLVKFKKQSQYEFFNNTVSWHYNFSLHRCLLLNKTNLSWYHLCDVLEEREIATAWGSGSRIEASITPHEEVLKYITNVEIHYKNDERLKCCAAFS